LWNWKFQQRLVSALFTDELAADAIEKVIDPETYTTLSP
jgi:hypothetical protein